MLARLHPHLGTVGLQPWLKTTIPATVPDAAFAAANIVPDVAMGAT
jgi:hypothetical protein